MALIKQTTSTVYARDAVVLNLGDLQRQGEQIVEQARRRADAIVKEAQAERERLLAGASELGRQEGHAKGYAEGLEQGKTAGQAQTMAEVRPRLEALQAAWAGALDAFLADRARMLHEAETDVLRLAVAIAERVTKRVVLLNPAVVVDQLRAALGLIVRPTALDLAISPDDRALAAQALPDLLKRFPSVLHAELLDDPTLPRGSCVVRTRGGRPDAAEAATETGGGGGEIDASIGTQMERIALALLPGDTDAAGGEGGSTSVNGGAA